MFYLDKKYLKGKKWIIYILLLIIFSPAYLYTYPFIFSFILYQHFSPFKKGFWSSQPIHNDKYGLIKTPDEIILEKDILNNNQEKWVFIKDQDEIAKICSFLQKYYEKDLIITPKYINWLINNQNYILIGIIKDDEIIGTIGASWNIYRIDEKITSGFYVDLLCIDKQYRKKGYAVKLIKKIIELWKEKKGTINLFKLDTVKIQPREDFIFHYYLLDKTKINPHLSNHHKSQDIGFELVSDKNIERTYQYFQGQMTKYPIREVYTFEKFKKWILSDNSITSSYICLKKDEIVGFVNLMKNEYKKNNDAVKVIDIVYLFGQKMDIMKYILQFDFQYYIILNIADHLDIIQRYQMERLYDTKYYFYNYELLDKYKNTDVGIHRF